MPIENGATGLWFYCVRHEVLECSPELADTAEFCEHYGFALDQAANTIPVASRKVEPPRGLLDAKRASFADAETTTALTGMLVGGVTAPGIEGLPIYVDRTEMEAPRIVMGGGNRSSKIVLGRTCHAASTGDAAAGLRSWRSPVSPGSGASFANWLWRPAQPDAYRG